VEKPASIPEGWEKKPSPRRILVVDDDEDIRRFNADVLTRMGYHVEAAADGAAGWDALNANRYDLLITDNNMPKLSGVELIKKINTAGIPVPIILSSGVPQNEEVELRLAAILPKPFTLDELLGTVKKVLTEAHGPGEWAPPSSSNPPDGWQV